MGFNHFRYARRVDADTIGLHSNDMTRLLTIDKATANMTVVSGLGTAGKQFRLKATGADTFPYIEMTGDSYIKMVAKGQHDWNIGTTHIARMLLTGGGGSFHLKESTTPTAIANYGAIYTKADNHLYFQDGAGAEHDMGSP